MFCGICSRNYSKWENIAMIVTNRDIFRTGCQKDYLFNFTGTATLSCARHGARSFLVNNRFLSNHNPRDISRRCLTPCCRGHARVRLYNLTAGEWSRNSACMRLRGGIVRRTRGSWASQARRVTLVPRSRRKARHPPRIRQYAQDSGILGSPKCIPVIPFTAVPFIASYGYRHIGVVCFPTFLPTVWEIFSVRRPIDLWYGSLFSPRYQVPNDLKVPESTSNIRPLPASAILDE